MIPKESLDMALNTKPFITPFVLLTGLLVCVSSWGCRPSDDQVRLGYTGEFCVVNDDCRDGLSCENSVCSGGAEQAGDITCAEMCARLVDECGRAEDDCEGSCLETITGWSDEAVNTFGACTLGMTTPELTCELAREDDAPSFCYRQIELDEGRKMRCDEFVERARDYAVSPSDTQLATLRQDCYIFARTRPDVNDLVPEESWSKTDSCVEGGDTMLRPDEVVKCYNDVFKLDPAFTVPDPDSIDGVIPEPMPL